MSRPFECESRAEIQVDKVWEELHLIPRTPEIFGCVESQQIPWGYKTSRMWMSGGGSMDLKALQGLSMKLK